MTLFFFDAATTTKTITYNKNSGIKEERFSSLLKKQSFVDLVDLAGLTSSFIRE